MKEVTHIDLKIRTRTKKKCQYEKVGETFETML